VSTSAGSDGSEGRAPRLSPPAWADDIPAETWRAASDAIRETCRAGGTIGLVCHADPDGDALGSVLALHLFLSRAGCDTVPSWGSDPFSVPPQYTFLPGLADLVPPREFPEAPDLLICCDTASEDRLGTLAPVRERAGTVIVIDHHESGEGFGDIDLIAPHAAATVVLVDDLIHRLGGRPDREIASCLYAGLVTDTGRFQSRMTDAAAMEMGGRLLAEGIEHEEMSRQMFETHSFGYLKVLARVLDRATFVPESSLVHAWVEQADLERFGVALEETEGIIDVLRTAEAAEVTMILKETADGDWRVSLRSKGRTNVGDLAIQHDGGGHAASAGFTARGPREEIVRSVVERLSRRVGRSEEGAPARDEHARATPDAGDD
jgi:bifunctional oligoribonuclease and PAP phosphatase NrnA